MQDKPQPRSDSVHPVEPGFDPDAAATLDTLFGLPHSRDQAAIVVLGVPWDATASYGKGAADGPEAIRAASLQLDYSDRLFGQAWQAGVFMEPHDAALAARNERAKSITAPIIEKGGADESDAAAVAEIDALGAEIRERTRAFAAGAVDEGKVPVLLGGEHSVVEGAIAGCAESGPLGVLQIDAHMDLRPAFEGFRFSHASVLRNALGSVPNLTALAQVGIRDWSAGEQALAEADQRVSVFYDDDLDRTDWPAQCRRIVATLPERVYVTVDIDGLDPALCPTTGTPVPGGLAWRELGVLLKILAESGKRIVGADLVEVAPGPTEWDANVGARVLYRLCGAVARSNGLV